MSHIFISYSRKDSELVEKIVDALTEDNLKPWLDWKSIPKGEEVQREIHQSIEEADIFLFFVSPNSVQSKWCIDEIEHAAQNNKRILPIIIRDTDPKVIQPEISKRNWIFCRDGLDDFSKAIEETRETIHTDYEWLKYHTELQVKALKWEQKKDASRLLRGKELREAEEQLAAAGGQKDPQPTELHRNYVLASQRNEVHQRRQITIGLGFGLVVVTLLAVFAWNQRNSALNSEATAIAESNAKATALANEESARATAQAEKVHAEEQAKIALSRQLAAQAVLESQMNLPLSFLLSVEAVERSDTYEAKNILFKNLQKRNIISSLTGHSSEILCVAVSPNGGILASGGWDKAIILWDISNPEAPVQISKPITTDSAIHSLEFSPNGRILASATTEHDAIVLWDVSDPSVPIQLSQPLVAGANGGFVVSIFPDVSNKARLAFSPNGMILALGGNNETVVLWDVSDPTYPVMLYQTSRIHSSMVTSIAFGHAGEILASSDVRGNIILWKIGGTSKLIEIGHIQIEDGNTLDVAISPDGNILAANSGGNILLWNISDPSAPEQFSRALRGHTNHVESIAFDLTGDVLASGSWDQSIILWDISKPDAPETIDLPLLGHTGNIYAVSFSPDGHKLYSASADRIIVLWDLENPAPLLQYTPTLIGHAQNITTLSFSPDGLLLASSSYETTLLWDISDPHKPLQLGQIPFGDNVVFSPSDRLLATDGPDQTIALWDISDPASPQMLSNSIAGDNIMGMRSIAFSPDGKYLASGGSLWDISNPARPQQFGQGFGGAGSVVISPNGRILAFEEFFGEDDTIMLVNIADPKQPEKLQQTLHGNVAAFTPDNQFLAMLQYNIDTVEHSYITLWDISNPQVPLKIGKPATDFFYFLDSIALTPDGKILAAGGGSSNEGGIYLWDISNPNLPQPLGQPFHLSTGVNSLAFSPNGRLLVSASYEYTLTLWDMNITFWKERSCQIANRNLSLDEWRSFIGDEPYRATCPNLPIPTE